MKNLLTKISVLSVALLMSLILVGCGQSKQQKNTNAYSPSQSEVKEFEDHAQEEHGEGHEYVNAKQLANYDSGELSQQEADDIIHMRQEEKLARDVYRTLGETYAINQFKNIPLSEQKHTDAMELLLQRYDIEDPIVDETQVGTYKDQKFIDLYIQLTEQGKESLTDALTVGATIEDLNMAKLLKVINNTDNEDIQFVYESVLEQSHHHMNSFISGLDKHGETYIPTYVSQEYFDRVVSG